VDVFWQAGQVRLSPPSGNSGLRGQSGSKGKVKDLGGMAVVENGVAGRATDNPVRTLRSGMGADAMVVTQTLALLLAENIPRTTDGT
jgi:hypothetical protein